MLATTTTPKPKLDFTDPAPGFEHPETHNSSSALMTLGYHPPGSYHLPGTTHRTPTELSSHRNEHHLPSIRQMGASYAGDAHSAAGSTDAKSLEPKGGFLVVGVTIIKTPSPSFFLREIEAAFLRVLIRIVINAPALGCDRTLALRIICAGGNIRF